MPQIPHWSEPEESGAFDDSWDALRLGGVFVPGVPTVTVKRPVAKIDKQKAKGKTGAKPKDQGADPASVKIRVTLITRADLEIWQRDVHPLIVPKPGVAPKPQSIEHPNCAVAGVSAVIIENVDYGHPSAKGGWQIDIDATEYTPAPPNAPGLGGLKGVGANESCAALSAKAQAATSKRESLQAANADAIAVYGQLQTNKQLVSTSQLSTAKAKVKETAAALELAKAEEGALYAAIASKCKKTAAPPSKTAQENVK